jgi:DUF1365 family protein
MIENSSIIDMSIYHKRSSPKSYAFSHKMLYMILKLEDINADIKTKLFSINRINFFSLFMKDYGFKKFGDPIKYIKQTLDDFNIKPSNAHSIFLLTMPKFLGLGFNPVSFWLCFNKDQLLCVVLAEVNNTFGERHGYLCFNKGLEPISHFNTINHPKVFHVSPFCKVQGHYEFRFAINKKNVKIDIDYYDEDKKLITTSIKGDAQEVTDKNLIKYLFAIPIMTIKVIFLIHYHALFLWFRKIPYITKPIKPDSDIT